VFLCTKYILFYTIYFVQRKLRVHLLLQFPKSLILVAPGQRSTQFLRLTSQQALEMFRSLDRGRIQVIICIFFFNYILFLFNKFESFQLRLCFLVNHKYIIYLVKKVIFFNV
jgi:hypothetical protein